MKKDLGFNKIALAQFFADLSKDELREVCRLLMPIISRKFRRAK